MADAANADADEVEDNSNLTVRMPALQPASPQRHQDWSSRSVAPPQLSSAGGAARQISPRVWHVPQHLAMENCEVGGEREHKHDHEDGASLPFEGHLPRAWDPPKTSATALFGIRHVPQ